MPHWLINLLDRFGLGNMEALLSRLGQGAAQGSQLIATHALNIGQNAFDFLVSFA